MGTPIATAEWADPALVEERYYYQEGDVWLGRSPSDTQLPVGYHDDRHVCLVSGSRAGKGTSTIITNLCLWPGSIVVVDPKGENATVTAPRRGKGSANCEGLGQSVQVLDPFSSALVDDDYRSRFNPLDALNPDNEETVDEAGRIADALVVIHDGNDPFWDESARAMVKALILHVLTAQEYEGRRNLITLRKLITRGDWEAVEALREAGEPDIPPGQGLLWTRVAANSAFEGIIAGLGDSFTNMLVNSPKQFESVLQVANRNTEFIDSPAMQRTLEASDFTLSALKTDPKGMSLYLCLPQRYMNTHYRWLRMMIALTVTEMEIVRGRPAAGFPVLMLLDEFAGLKRMEIIEHAVAQIAGYGVKLFFVLQSLEQLKAVYKDNWETFLSNSGLKIFFSLDDHFSRDYVSKLVGETEVMREVRSGSESDSESESFSHTVNRSRTRGRSVSDGTNWSDTDSQSRGINSSQSRSRGGTFGRSWNPAGILGLTEKNTQYSRNRNWSKSRTEGTSQGWSHSHTGGGSHSTSESESYTQGESFGTTHGTSHSHTTGMSETIHKRALVTPDEIGHLFARINDPRRAAYPGLALVVISGERAIALRRVNYFEDYQFARRFEPHPDFPSPPRWNDLRVTLAGITPYNRFLKACGFPNAEIGDWHARGGQLVSGGDTVLTMVVAKSAVAIRSPYTGMITELSEPDEKGLFRWLFSLRYAETDEPQTYPFAEVASYMEKYTAGIRATTAKAALHMWLMGGVGLLLLIGAIATKQPALLVLVTMAFIYALRKRAERRGCASVLASYAKLLKGDPEGWWRQKDLPVECGPKVLAEASPDKPVETQAVAPPSAPIDAQAALPPAQPVPADIPAAPSPAAQEVKSGISETAESPPEFRLAGQQPPKGEGMLSAVPDVQAEKVASESSQPEPTPALSRDVKVSRAEAAPAPPAAQEPASPSVPPRRNEAPEPSLPEPVSPAPLQVQTQRSVLPERPKAAPAPPIQPVVRVIEQPVPEAPVRPKILKNKQVRLLVFAVGAVVAGLVLSLGVTEIVQQPWWHIGASGENKSLRTTSSHTTQASSVEPKRRAEKLSVRAGLVRTIRGASGFGLAFSPDGRVLAFGSSKSLVLWNIAAGSQICSIATNPESFAFSRDGGLLASVDFDRSDKLWDPRTCKEVRPISGLQSEELSVAFSPDSSVVAFGGRDGTIGMWDVRSGNVLNRIPSMQGPSVARVIFSPNGRLLASRSDGSLKVWKVSTETELHEMAIPRESYDGIAFSPDSRLVAAVAEREIRLWDTSTGREVRTFRGHKFGVVSVAFSPDGRLLASGGNDYTIRIWDVATGAELKTIWGHRNYVADVTFSPDGRLLASASGDGTVKLWRVSERERK